MLYLIGLGLNKDSISIEGMDALKECEQVYLESYTVDFPYTVETLEKSIKNKIIILDRAQVESEDLIKEAKKKNVALLVYGCPLFATTHMSLISDAKSARVKTKIIYAASVFDAIAESGLQLYKFGKITSMPTWQKSYEPYSFLESVQENQSIQAHSLILIDIGLEFNDALEQLEKALNKPEIKVKIEKMIICSNLGTKDSKFSYDSINKLKTKKISKPFCFIIPGKMHFLEEEIVESF